MEFDNNKPITAIKKPLFKKVNNNIDMDKDSEEEIGNEDFIQDRRNKRLTRSNQKQISKERFFSTQHLLQPRIKR